MKRWQPGCGRLMSCRADPDSATCGHRTWGV